MVQGSVFRLGTEIRILTDFNIFPNPKGTERFYFWGGKHKSAGKKQQKKKNRDFHGKDFITNEGNGLVS